MTLLRFSIGLVVFIFSCSVESKSIQLSTFATHSYSFNHPSRMEWADSITSLHYTLTEYLYLNSNTHGLMRLSRSIPILFLEYSLSHTVARVIHDSGARTYLFNSHLNNRFSNPYAPLVAHWDMYVNALFDYQFIYQSLPYQTLSLNQKAAAYSSSINSNTAYASHMNTMSLIKNRYHYLESTDSYANKLFGVMQFKEFSSHNTTYLLALNQNGSSVSRADIYNWYLGSALLSGSTINHLKTVYTYATTSQFDTQPLSVSISPITVYIPELSVYLHPQSVTLHSDFIFRYRSYTLLSIGYETVIEGNPLSNEISATIQSTFQSYTYRLTGVINTTRDTFYSLYLEHPIQPNLSLFYTLFIGNSRTLHQQRVWGSSDNAFGAGCRIHF